MATFKKFEEIKSWQLARDLVSQIYGLTDSYLKKNYFFVNQIRRAAVSVMANIAEGFERYSKKEFIQFLVIAKGSAGEVRSHLYVALDTGRIQKKQFEQIKEQCEIVSKHIWNLIIYLKEK